MILGGYPEQYLLGGCWGLCIWDASLGCGAKVIVGNGCASGIACCIWGRVFGIAFGMVWGRYSRYGIGRLCWCNGMLHLNRVLRVAFGMVLCFLGRGIRSGIWELYWEWGSGMWSATAACVWGVTLEVTLAIELGVVSGVWLWNGIWGGSCCMALGVALEIIYHCGI